VIKAAVLAVALSHMFFGQVIEGMGNLFEGEQVNHCSVMSKNNLCGFRPDISPCLILSDFTRVSSHLSGDTKRLQQEDSSRDSEKHHYPLGDSVLKREQPSGPIEPIWPAVVIVGAIVLLGAAIGYVASLWVYGRR